MLKVSAIIEVEGDYKPTGLEGGSDVRKTVVWIRTFDCVAGVMG